MVEITFYGGVGEIGGNKILLRDEDTKIFLDFGMSFNKRGLYFEEFLKPRTSNGIGDFLQMGLIPDISGIYRDDLLTHYGRKPETPDIQGVLLSHAHADHANYVSFLHEKIPIYCGKTCLSILEAVEEQSQRSIESEVLNYKKRPLFRRDYKKPAINRDIVTFHPCKSFKIDSLDIEPFPVDHSVPGAFGFIIHSSEGPIIYTGDMRLHGQHGQYTKEFVEKASEAKPIAMITEGTRINETKTDESEKKVYTDSKKIINKEKNVSIVDFNFKDLDRFQTFYQIAKDLDKQLVINFKHACFLERYHQDPFVEAPNSTDESISLLLPKRHTGTYNKEDYSDAYVKKRLDYPNIIQAEEIIKNPRKYMVVLNFWYFNMLIDLKPYHGTYIHSLSEPFNEEMEISYDRMKNWLNHFDLNLNQSHCSGHINGTDLKHVIQKIKPETLFPVHTKKPESFTSFHDNTVRVIQGKLYKL
ncbi:MBL fold metallo-hydrolase [Thermoplasmatales archaeon ex4572_165]|nr:MAG: MBL fold metallo-hydrolase [Thermoplasmatales archaeon ex4572_165]